MLAFSGIENTPVANTDSARATTNLDMNGEITEEEGSLVLPDGITLYTKCWKPGGKPRAIIAFYHGFNDHCNSFLDFLPNLASSGFEIRSVDQRGWGRSVTSNRKLRGNFGTTPVVMADLHFFLQSLVPYTKEGSIPLFLMGHSMGGMNPLYYILNPESPYHTRNSDTNNNNNNSNSQTSSSPTSQFKLAGVISIAPLVALHPATQPSKLLEYAGRIAQRIVPKMTIPQPMPAKYVTRNPTMLENIPKDNLLHNLGTLEGFRGMLDRGVWLDSLHATNKNKNKSQNQNQKEEVDAATFAGNIPPIWAGHGTSDYITWYDGTKRLIESLDYVEDKTFKTYEGAYHKVMNEPDGQAEEITKDVTEWIEAHIPKAED